MQINAFHLIYEYNFIQKGNYAFNNHPDVDQNKSSFNHRLKFLMQFKFILIKFGILLIMGATFLSICFQRSTSSIYNLNFFDLKAIKRISSITDLFLMAFKLQVIL